MIYRQHRGKVCIPGSTLKGWLRAHCRRILLTLLGGAGKERTDRAKQLLAELFGSTEQGQGILRFEDALATAEPGRLHPQTFIAVDRFTGGAKSSALYQVEAVWPEAFENCHLHYRKGKLNEWMKMLLLYALRDAMEGDLVVGWGKSRGYGRLTLIPEDIEINRYDQQQLTAWHQALQRKLEQEAAA